MPIISYCVHDFGTDKNDTNKTYLYFLDCSFDFQNQLILEIFKFIFSIVFKISLAISATESNCLDARSQRVLLSMFEEGISDEIYGCLEMLREDIQKIVITSSTASVSRRYNFSY